MKQVNYIQNCDELEILFKEVEVPEVIKLDSGISLEFDNKQLSAIILPNFFQMLHRQPTGQEEIKLVDWNTDTLQLNIDGQIVNVKLGLKEADFNK